MAKKCAFTFCGNRVSLILFKKNYGYSIKNKFLTTCFPKLARIPYSPFLKQSIRNYKKNSQNWILWALGDRFDFDSLLKFISENYQLDFILWGKIERNIFVDDFYQTKKIYES